MGNAGTEAATTAAGGAAEDGPGAAAETETGTYRAGRPEKIADWSAMIKRQRKNGTSGEVRGAGCSFGFCLCHETDLRKDHD